MPQESSDTYSHIYHDTITGRGASKKSREDTVAEDVEMGGYSILSYGDKPGAYSGPAIFKKQGKKRKKESKKLSADATVDQLYAQVDKKKKEDGDTTHPHPPEPDASVDQLYAQVDKKKKKDGDTTHPHPPEADTSVDQLYAQVDKKNEKDGDTTHPHPPEDDAPVDQLYAEVDKKKKSKGKVCEESGEVYSVVNKPHPPQVPAKSDLLMDDLYN